MPNVQYTIIVDSAGALTSINKVGTALVQTATTGKTAFSEVKAETSSLSSAFGHLGNTMKNIFTILGVVQLASAIREGVQAASDFQHEWTKVAVIMRGETDPTVLLKFKKELFDLPPIFGDAAKNATAFYEILSSGFTEPAEALTLLKAAATAAAGGFTETSVAVKAGSAVLHAYGMDVSQATHVFDIMAKTVDLGVIRFEELAAELGNIIPLAAINSVSFEELSAVIASLTLQGMTASDAITGVRSMLSGLLEPNAQAEKAAARLGIMWSAAAVKAIGLEGVIKQLSDRSKVTAEDIALLTGRVEANKVASAASSEGGIAKLNIALKATHEASKNLGSSEESLNKVKEQSITTWDELSVMTAKLAQQWGDDLAPSLAKIATKLKEVIDSLKDGVLIMNEYTIAVISLAGAFAAVKIAKILEAIAATKALRSLLLAFDAATLTATFGHLGAAFSGLASGLGLVTAAGALTMAGWVLIIAAAAALGYAIVELYGYWRQLGVEQDNARASATALALDLNSRGVPGVKAWLAALTSGSITLETYNKKLKELSEEQKKNNPEQWAKPDVLKEWNSIVTKMGVTTVESFKATAKAASEAVARIKEIGPVTADYSTVLARAEAAQNKAWDTFKEAVKNAKGGVKDLGEEARKATKELLSMASAAGDTVPQLLAQEQEIAKYIALLSKQKDALGQLHTASEALAEVHNKIANATNLNTVLMSQWLKDATPRVKSATEGFEQFGDSLKESEAGFIAANAASLEMEKGLRDMGLAAKVAGDNLAKLPPFIQNLSEAFKNLGLTSTAALQQTADNAAASYEAILNDATSSDRDRVLSWAAAEKARQEATFAATGQIDLEALRAAHEIQEQFGSLKNNKDANLTNWAELSKRQVSTLVSDVSKGFADILFRAGSFGEKMKSAFKNIGSGIVQAFFESGILGLLSGKGLQGFGDFTSGLIDAVTGGLGKKQKTATETATELGIKTKKNVTPAVSEAVTKSSYISSVIPEILTAGSTIASAGASKSTKAATLASTIGRLVMPRKEAAATQTKADELSKEVREVLPMIEAGTSAIEQGVVRAQTAWGIYIKFLQTNLIAFASVIQGVDAQIVLLLEKMGLLQQIGSSAQNAIEIQDVASAPFKVPQEVFMRAGDDEQLEQAQKNASDSQKVKTEIETLQSGLKATVTIQANAIFDAILAGGTKGLDGLLGYAKNYFAVQLKKTFSSLLEGLFTDGKRGGVGGVFGGGSDASGLIFSAVGANRRNQTQESTKVAEAVKTGVTLATGKAAEASCSCFERNIEKLARPIQASSGGLARAAGVLVGVGGLFAGMGRAAAPAAVGKTSVKLITDAGQVVGGLAPGASALGSSVAGATGAGIGALPTSVPSFLGGSSAMIPGTAAGTAATTAGTAGTTAGATGTGITGGANVKLASTRLGQFLKTPAGGMVAGGVAGFAAGYGTGRALQIGGKRSAIAGGVGAGVGTVVGAFFGPVVGAAVGAAAGALTAATLRIFGGKAQEAIIAKEIERDFAIVVRDNKLLTQIKKAGESAFGKDAPKKRFETLRLDTVQGMLLTHAKFTNQSPAMLPIYRRFYGEGGIPDNQRINISKYANGGMVVPQSIGMIAAHDIGGLVKAKHAGTKYKEMGGTTKSDPGSWWNVVATGRTTSAPEVSQWKSGFGKPADVTTGGMIPGVDRGRDEVLGMLRPGEFVLRTEVVRAIGVDRLHRLNSGSTQPVMRYASGGLVKGGSTGNADFRSTVSGLQLTVSPVVNVNVAPSSGSPQELAILAGEAVTKAVEKSGRELVRGLTKALNKDQGRTRFRQSIFGT